MTAADDSGDHLLTWVISQTVKVHTSLSKNTKVGKVDLNFAKPMISHHFLSGPPIGWYFL